jgi:hypothetical protein
MDSISRRDVLAATAATGLASIDQRYEGAVRKPFLIVPTDSADLSSSNRKGNAMSLYPEAVAAVRTISPSGGLQ